MSGIYEFLRDIYFFKDLEDTDIHYISRFGTEIKAPPGHILFREKDPALDFYVIVSGSVEIWKNHGNNDAALLAVQTAGHIFGEMALVDDQDRSATVVTREPSSFIVISHRNFESIMKKRPRVMFCILRSLSKIVRESNDAFIDNLDRQNKELQKANRELKDAQDELLRSERFSNLGKFASFILHDLRNPIAMIRGYGEMIVLGSGDNTELNGFAHKIINEADQVHRFANELLDYSRGDIRLNYVLTTIDSIFAKLFSYVKENFERRQISINFENNASRLVMLDSERILRALINIIDNARKASNPGDTVWVEASADSDKLLLTVRDEGEGMDEEVVSRMFEPFFSNSSKGGTGLGMLIVKNVIEAHQGTITIRSKKGEGTDISIRLPFEP